MPSPATSHRGSATAAAAVQLRRVRPDEIEAVRALLAANGWSHRVADKAQFARLVAASSLAEVAIHDGRIVGFVRGLTDGLSNGYLSMLVVHPDQRGRGIGRMLVEQAVGTNPDVSWVARAGREGANDFFAKLGFAASAVAMERLRTHGSRSHAEEARRHETPARRATRRATGRADESTEPAALTRPRARAKPRIQIRSPAADDQRAFLAAVERSRALHHPWTAPPATPAAFKAYVERMAAPLNAGFLVCRLDTGEPVGVVNVTNMVLGLFRSAYVGYYAFAGHERQGFMREGLRAVVQHAFTSLKLHRLEANIQPDNVASLALIRACGFSKEGYSPRYLKINGRWRDHERWAIVAS